MCSTHRMQSNGHKDAENREMMQSHKNSLNLTPPPLVFLYLQRVFICVLAFLKQVFFPVLFLSSSHVFFKSASFPNISHIFVFACRRTSATVRVQEENDGGRMWTGCRVTDIMTPSKTHLGELDSSTSMYAFWHLKARNREKMRGFSGK